MTKADDYNTSQLAAGALAIENITTLVHAWQQSHPPLEVDGMAGPATIASIAASMRPIPFLALPLPILPDGRKPVVTSSFRPPDRPNHDGCDWFYAWKTGDKPDFVGDHGAAGKNPNGTPKWVVPIGALAVTAASGKVQLASASPTGIRVWIDHGNGWRTGYFHLLDMRVHVGSVVVTGDPIGLVGDNPMDNDGRHLHFELSPVAVYAPIDPEPYLIR